MKSLATTMALSFLCAAAPITVDPGGGGDLTEIQPAIEAAVDGATVLVMPGKDVVVESIDFGNKPITVRSEWTSSTTIDNIPPASKVDFFLGACYLRRAARIVAADQQSPEPERESTAQSYADRAMQSLAKSLEKGFRDAKALESLLEGIEPLRGRADFKELLHALKQRK